MKRRSNFIYVLALIFLMFLSCNQNKTLNYKTLQKIDAHVHVRTDNPEILKMAQAENFSFLTICTRASS